MAYIKPFPFTPCERLQIIVKVVETQISGHTLTKPVFSMLFNGGNGFYPFQRDPQPNCLPKIASREKQTIELERL